MAPLVQELRAETGLHGVFVQRLMFAVRFAEFHQRRVQGLFEHAALDLLSLFEEDLAPRSWWGVLLNDATPFLQDGKSFGVRHCIFEFNHNLEFLESRRPIPSTGVSLLLQKLEEVNMMTAQGSGEDYLTILSRVLNVSSVNDALRQLDTLRLALARYYARCTLANSTSLIKNDPRLA